MLKNTTLISLVIGAIVGSMTTYWWFNQTEPTLRTGQLQCDTDEFEPEFSTNQSGDLSSSNRANFAQPVKPSLAAKCGNLYSTDLDQSETARQLRQLDSSRSILPHDLSRLNHWTSMSSFSNALEQLNLTASSKNHLLAKAYVLYKSDYISALESLFSAQQSADDDERIEMFQGEIDVLLDYVRRQYFSENHVMSIDTFTRVMNLANEKQPNNVDVLSSLVRHHLLVGEYHLATNFIERIPPDIDNLTTINALNRKLEKTMTASQSLGKGIPLKRSGEHFIVEVTFNGHYSLNLMLDTGASRTVLSQRAIQTLVALSEGVTDLDMTGRVQTANGTALARLYQTEQISIENFYLDNPLVLVTQMSENTKFDGLLGMDFLNRFEFQIDYSQNRLHLSY